MLRFTFFDHLTKEIFDWSIFYQYLDVSCMLKSIHDDLTAAGENNGEYLEVAKKGGRKGEESLYENHCLKIHVYYMNEERDV